VVNSFDDSVPTSEASVESAESLEAIRGVGSRTREGRRTRSGGSEPV